MVFAIHHAEANGITNPRIFFAAVRPGPAGDASDADAGSGFLLDPTSLTYRLVNPDGTELQAATAVNLVGEKLGVGRFAPAFTINDVGGGGLEGDAGVYTVEWVAVIPFGGGTETITKTTTFRLVVAAEVIPDAYALISDLRDEGVPDAGIFSDARLKTALERAKAYITRVTHRTFEPQYKSLNVDARGGPILQINEPIIAIEEVNFTFTTFSPTDLPVQQGDLRVYNRHIRENLTHPDDRNDPRIEFLRVESTRFAQAFNGPNLDLGSPVLFSRSQQNVNLVGLFGYTDHDGSPTGDTPELIKWVNMRLAFRYLRPMFTTVSRDGSVPSGPVTSEKTRDQAISYATPGSGSSSTAGAFTGDPEIDQILASFTRPPHFAAV